LASESELSEFLKSVEKRAFKRSVYHVRNQESALDIVQDSMMKLAEHYGHKPIEELPMLFQRILSNCTLDWFRRQKTQNALFSNLSDFEAFLMRYWEEMDVAETAAAMGCSQGSVKTHCSRAVHALGQALKAKGIRL
jgi:RNA polymerase sigma-70 factor (ECF subfamily)